MTRALYSAVSGLQNQQTGMDVIGDNISNVNTIGFKGSRVDFQSAFVQESRAANANTPIGLAVGLGSQVAGTQTLFSQGAFQRTDVNTDIGISGFGFLITAAGTGSGPATTAPQPGASGGTTGAGGFYTRAGETILDSQRYIRTPDGKFIYGVMADAEAGGNITATVAGYTASGTADFSLDTNDASLMAANTGNVTDNPGAFSAIRIPGYINVSHSNGAYGVIAGAGSNSSPTNFAVSSNAVSFASIDPASSTNYIIAYVSAASDLAVSNGAATGSYISNERVANFSFATDGAITVVSDQGTARRVGYMTIAYFSNDSGLRDAGSSYFTSTPASGNPTYYQPGVGPAGQTQAGTLELSNVDLATQFTQMIVTQRGFDANARTITTSSEMLQTLVNLGR